MDKKELLHKLLKRTEDFTFNQWGSANELHLIIKEIELINSKAFNSNTAYSLPVQDLLARKSKLLGNGILYQLRLKNDVINLIKTMLRDAEIELELGEENKGEDKHQEHIISKNKIIVTDSSKIFIVHGHNETMKETLARFLEKMQLQPIILHEQSNQGRTIIEKFTDNSDVHCAVVLLSADDYGYSKNESEVTKKYRARQNVILELGFFLGKLGRNKVMVLVEKNENFEFPSDYSGVIYIPFDKSWEKELIKELKAAGMKIDANKMFNQ